MRGRSRTHSRGHQATPRGVELGHELAERSVVPDTETKLRYRAQNAFAVGQAREAVETLWSFYGANAIYTRDPLQRYLRDVQASSQHFAFNFDVQGSAYGTAALGGKYANPNL